MSAVPAGRHPAGPDQRHGLVDTGVALRVAGRLATDPMQGSYLLEDLAGHFAELCAEAEPLVAEEAGFGPTTPAHSKVLSRAEWASANVTSIVRLLSPLLEKVDAKLPPGAPGSAFGLTRKAYGSALGAQLGGVLGFISQRVLGQYEIDPANAEEVWFVGPNIVITERRFGFVPRDFRLWVATHELTHRAQFEGNAWLRDYFTGSVHELLGSLELQPLSLLERALKAARPSGDDSTAPIGVRLLDDHQREIFDRIQALMSLVEGHGNFVMDRVATLAIPTQPRMRRSLRSGSWEGPLGKVLRRVLGLDMKRLQYEEGQRFCNAVFAVGGRDGVRAAFASAESLPTLEEIRDPERWLARVNP